MKNHKSIRWEANQRRRMNAYLPKLNKVLFALDKINPDMSDKIMTHSDEMRVNRPSAAERQACTKAFRQCGIKAIQHGLKSVNEYGIKYSTLYDFGSYRKEDYDGAVTDSKVEFKLTFSYDLAEDCKITYKEEQIEAKDCVVGDDGTIFKVVQVVDKIDCGDDLPTLESLGKQA